VTPPSEPLLDGRRASSLRLLGTTRLPDRTGDACDRTVPPWPCLGGGGRARPDPSAARVGALVDILMRTPHAGASTSGETRQGDAVTRAMRGARLPLLPPRWAWHARLQPTAGCCEAGPQRGSMALYRQK
jgi:hypothetical protein